MDIPAKKILADKAVGRLHKLMKKRDKKQEDVAIALGVVQETVSKWLSQTHAITGKNLKGFAEFLGVPPECILEGKNCGDDLADDVADSAPAASANEAASSASELVRIIAELGLTKVYRERVDATGDMLKDIRASQKGCWISAALYVDTLIKVYEQAPVKSALAEAALRAHSAGESYNLTYCSLSPYAGPDGFGAGNAFLLDCWAQREETKAHKLAEKIDGGSEAFQKMADEVKSTCSALRPERRYFENYLVPHALVVIDERIAYVALYDWGTQTGRRSPTMRFDAGTWGSKFVEESRIIREQFSYRAYKVIAFDFDGVIADSMPIQERAWRETGKSLPPGDAQKLLFNFGTGAAGERMFEGISSLENDAKKRKFLRKTKNALFDREESNVMPFAHVRRVLQSLVASGRYILAIATTAEKARLRKFLDAHQLSGFFDYMVSNEDKGVKPKPDPDMLYRIANRYGCQPWQVCLVGDTNTDFIMSRAAGTDFIHFKSHNRHGIPEKCTTATNWDELKALLLR